MSQASWAELDTLESFDTALSNVRDVAAVLADHRWLETCQRLAFDNGFFHWELDFAPVFGRGGFDLQVGNPPWVRPRSDEAALLAEGDPWWQLAEKPTQAQVRDRRQATLALDGMLELYIEGSIAVWQTAAFIGDNATYSLLGGLQPDLYRAFMARCWSSASGEGIAALVHPESHFKEDKARNLRAEAYRRLRRHWQFINELQLFEIGHTRTYGVHVYGRRAEQPSFIMAASLYHPDTVSRSLSHDGTGDVPGLKDGDDGWDLRPHAERIISVDKSVLAVWAEILDEPGTPPLQARMVYPVNRASSGVLAKLSKAPRVRELGLQYSRGWDESIDRKKGYFEVGSVTPESWSGAILQGSHFTVANPFFKQPNPSMKSIQDWTELDLEALPQNFIPRCNYRPTTNQADYSSDYDRWSLASGEVVSARNFYRVCWRSMAAPVGLRTLHVSLIPPGAAHVHAVRSAGTPSVESHFLLASLLGVLSSVVIDFMVKVSTGSEISAASIERLPMTFDPEICSLIAVRAAGLVKITRDYEEFLDGEFNGDGFAGLTRALDRRRAEIEIDALVAILFGLTCEELCAVYRTQFSVMRAVDSHQLFDSNRRRVPSEVARLFAQRGEELSTGERSWTHPQSGVEYVFEFPFVSYDREEDMRRAYAHFEKLLAEKS